MKLCASYNTKNDALTEIRYPASRLDLLIEQLIDHADKIYILEILSFEESNLKEAQLIDLCNENSHLIIDFYNKNDYIKFSTLIPHFMYHYPACTFNDLYWLMSFHPYAITIGEPLIFNIKRARQAVNDMTPENNYTQIRILPAIGRPSEWAPLAALKHDNGINHFWLIPQQLHIYEPYVDVLDLYDRNIEREQQLVKLYHKGTCNWGLNTLLRNCDISIPCELIPDEFTQHRLNCEQRCMRGNNSCDYCNRQIRLVSAWLTSHS